MDAQKTAWENLVKAFNDYSKFDPACDYVLYHLENEHTHGGSEISYNFIDKVSESDILTQAIEHYGEPAQVLKCIEELAELQYELYKSIASYSSSDQHMLNILRDHAEDDIEICKSVDVNKIKMCCMDKPSVVSKLTDVAITTHQMQRMFTTPEEFEKVKQAKLTRLVERMNGDESPTDIEILEENLNKELTEKERKEVRKWANVE